MEAESCEPHDADTEAVGGKAEDETGFNSFDSNVLSETWGSPCGEGGGEPFSSRPFVSK